MGMSKSKMTEKSQGVLVDITKCIGCDACSVACKMWNENEFENTRSHVQGRETKNLDYKNWTNITLHRINQEDNSEVWRYSKFQCLHCDEPACVASCFATALKKSESGAVVFYPNKCVGCRYCMLACPFDIIKYEWEKTFPIIAKCHLCHTRLAKDQAPACVGACPTGVMTVGKKYELLELAKETIANDSNYVQHIYGENEAGGTGWMYISDTPFEQLGFNTDVTTRPLPEYSYEYFQKYTTGVMIGWGTLLTALYLFNQRRSTIAKENKESL